MITQSICMSFSIVIINIDFNILITIVNNTINY